jgi:hypothetical protein
MAPSTPVARTDVASAKQIAANKYRRVAERYSAANESAAKGASVYGATSTAGAGGSA